MYLSRFTVFFIILAQDFRLTQHLLGMSISDNHAAHSKLGPHFQTYTNICKRFAHLFPPLKFPPAAQYLYVCLSVKLFKAEKKL